jgi:hypothetical protein
MRPAPVNDEGPGGGNTPPDKPKPKPAGNGTPQK